MERIIPYIIENKKCSKPPNREDWTQNPQEQTKSITELWKDVAQYISARPSLEWWAWIVIKLIKQDGSNSIQGPNLINDVAMEWFGTLAFTIITQKRDYNYSMTTNPSVWGGSLEVYWSHSPSHTHLGWFTFPFQIFLTSCLNPHEPHVSPYWVLW